MDGLGARLPPSSLNEQMGKILPRSFEAIRTGDAVRLRVFTNVAAATSAGFTAAKCRGQLIELTAGGTGSVRCLAFSDGTNWKQIAIGANAI